MRRFQFIERYISSLEMRRCRTIREDIILVITYMIRSHCNLPPFGHDTDADEKVYRHTVCFLEPTRDDAETLGDDEALLIWLSGDDTSSRARDNYLRIQHRLLSLRDAQAAIECSYETLYGRTLSPLTSSHIRSIQTEVRTVRRRVYNLWMQSKYKKFEISIRDLTAYIPLVSFSLICAGYFHTSIVYEHFGLDPTQFFSIGDYLSTSLQQIEYAVWLPVSYLAGFGYGRLTRPAMPKLHSDRTVRQDRLFINLFSIVAVGSIVAIGLRWEYYASLPKITWYCGFCMLFLMLSLREFVPRRFLPRSANAQALLIGLLLFSGMIIANSYMKINVIKHGKVYEQFEIVRQSERYTEDNASVIGSNSSYMFVWVEGRKVDVIPLREIDRFTISLE